MSLNLSELKQRFRSPRRFSQVRFQNTEIRNTMQRVSFRNIRIAGGIVSRNFRNLSAVAGPAGNLSAVVDALVKSLKCETIFN